MDTSALPCPASPPPFLISGLSRPRPSLASPIVHLADEVYQLYRLDGRAPKTCSRVRQIFREIIAMGVTTTGQIDPILVATWLESTRSKTTGEPRSSLTKKALSSTLKTVLKFGVGRGYLERSPYDAWSPRFKGKKATMKRHHSYADLVRVQADLAAAACEGWKEHRIYAVASTFMATGLRKMEGLRLKLCDIDLENQTLSVSARYRLKTESSERTIGLPDALVAILRGWIPECGSEWLFPNLYRTSFWNEGSARNKPLSCLEAAGHRSGVEGLTFQSLRHSWATHAQLLWKLAPAAIAKNLGHTNLMTGFMHYTEADIDDLKEAVRTISFTRAREGDGDGTQARNSA